MQYEDVFAESVKKEPADIPPMKINIDLSRWHSNKHRLPPRPVSQARREEIIKQVTAYKDLGVIRESTASAWSQVHLVRKSPPPEDSWRFCIDFVRLNDCTIGQEGWPIPNISNTLIRVGEKKPRVLGVMDMTSGYHQAPLDEASREFTAFSCVLGLFEWSRVAMGLKNAAAHFQRVMAQTVLVGLVFNICELYIDDVLIFGSSDEEFLCNLEQVLVRIEKTQDYFESEEV
jgi:hypothetical protein